MTRDRAGRAQRIEAAYWRRAAFVFLFVVGLPLIVLAMMWPFIDEFRPVPPKAEALGNALTVCALVVEVAWFVVGAKRGYFRAARSSPVLIMSRQQRRVARAAVRGNQIPSGADPAHARAMAEAMRLGRWQLGLAVGLVLLTTGQVLRSTFAIPMYLSGGAAVMLATGVALILRDVAAADRFLAVDRGRVLREDGAARDG